MKRIAVKAAIVLIFPILVGLSMGVLNFFIHLNKVNPTKDAAYKWPYYIYISESVKAKAEKGEEITILVLPNNTGRTDDNMEKHDCSSKMLAFMGHMAFKNLNAVILVPVFPRPAKYGLIYTHALDRDVMETQFSDLQRLDLQLEGMIDDVIAQSEEKGWAVNSKVVMWGFSASGMFVNRFAVLHPDRILAASIGSPGGWPIAPVRMYDNQELRYPIGVSDIKEISGEAFNIEMYKKIPQLFFIGGQDENDSVPYGDSYEDQDRIIINRLFGSKPVERWRKAEKIYEEVGANALFKIYKGVGHRPTIESLKETKNLFLKAIEGTEVINYNHEPNHKIKGVRIIDLKNGAKHLFFYGSRHSNDKGDPMFKDIEDKFFSTNPQVVLVEGDMNRIRYSDADTATKSGESAYVSFLAQKNHIPLKSVEPSMERQYEYLLSKYDKYKVLLMYILRQVEQYQREQESNPIVFREAMESFVSGMVNEGFPLDEDEAKLDNILDMMGAYLELDIDENNWKSIDTIKYVFRDGADLNEIYNEIYRYRNRYLVSVIEENLKKYDRVFVIMGSSHVKDEKTNIEDIFKRME